jgi:hypothetical protein
VSHVKTSSYTIADLAAREPRPLTREIVRDMVSRSMMTAMKGKVL